MMGIITRMTLVMTVTEGELARTKGIAESDPNSKPIRWQFW
jgi:hypothetical protein